ncbi:MAG: FAD-dependent oxidoreductase, partial [Pseudolabrys sp.]
REHLTRELELRGIKVLTRKIVKAVEKVDHGFYVELSDNEQIVVDLAMFATGRRPNVEGLGLETAGVKTSERSGIMVDAYSRTSVPNIYAVGDVTDRVNLTPVAIREGHAFADTVFGDKPTKVDHSNVPTAVFSEPEVGVIGLTEAQAVEKLGKVDIYKTSFRPMKATLSGRDTRVFMKLVVDGNTDKIVGCHIIGPDAAELIQVVGIAVTMGATKADFDATMAVHPTAAEELVTLREKAMTYGRAAAE